MKAKRNTLLIDWCTMFQNFFKKRNLFSSFFCRLCCIRPRRWFNPNETNKEELAIPILTEMRRRRKSRKIPACIFIFFPVRFHRCPLRTRLFFDSAKFLFQNVFFFSFNFCVHKVTESAKFCAKLPLLILQLRLGRRKRKTACKWTAEIICQTHCRCKHTHLSPPLPQIHFWKSAGIEAGKT